MGSLAGRIYAIDAADGELLWQRDVQGPVRAGLTINAGVIYAATDEGNLHAIDVETHQDRWIFKADASILARPAISEKAIYISTSRGTVTAVDTFGSQRWQFAP